MDGMLARVVTEAALKAARALAITHGLPATDAVVLHAGSNVVVHLAPAPVVVRVMTGTAALHGDPAAWLEREVSVCLHLARLGAAVVAPSDELPPGPHHVDELWMTCWAHVSVDHAASAPPPDELGHALRDLHAALFQVPVDLEPLAAVRDELTQPPRPPRRPTSGRLAGAARGRATRGPGDRKHSATRPRRCLA